MTTALPDRVPVGGSIYDLIEGVWSYSDRVRFCRTLRASDTALDAANTLGMSVKTLLRAAKALDMRIGTGDEAHHWTRYEPRSDTVVDGAALMDRIEGRSPLVLRMANMRKAEQMKRFGRVVSKAEAERQIQARNREVMKRVERAEMDLECRARIRTEAYFARLAAEERGVQEKSDAATRPEDPRHSFITMAQIISLASEFYVMPVSDIVGPSRSRNMVIARTAVMHCINELLPHKSRPQIGRALGGRDHATIVHGLRKSRAQFESFIAFCREQRA